MTGLNILGIELTEDEYALVNADIVNYHQYRWNNLSVVEKQEIIHNIIGR